MPLLFDRMKQGMASCRVRLQCGATVHAAEADGVEQEAATFFRKRAVIEEEYARSMIKLAKSSSESYAVSESKAG